MNNREYFRDKEVACKCGCGKFPRQSSLERLVAVRIIYGKPIIINSGARCLQHNVDIGGVHFSKHIIGAAFDIKIHENDWFQLIKIAMDCGFLGFGISRDFLHIDDGRDTGDIWTY